MRLSEKAGLWECDGCGKLFERSQLVSDDTNEDLCPECFGRDDRTVACRYYPDEIDVADMGYHARNGGVMLVITGLLEVGMLIFRTKLYRTFGVGCEDYRFIRIKKYGNNWSIWRKAKTILGWLRFGYGSPFRDDNNMFRSVDEWTSYNAALSGRRGATVRSKELL